MNFRTILKPFVLCSLLVCTLMSGFAQQPTDQIDVATFNANMFLRMLKEGIGELRLKNGLDTLMTHEIMDKAAQDQAGHMAEVGRAYLDQPDKKKSTTGKRNEFYGGTQNAEELVLQLPYSKGKKIFSYKEVVAEAVEKWSRGRKMMNEHILVPDFFYAGAGVAFNEQKKRLYISMMFGGIQAFNEGAPYRKTLPVPYTAKWFIFNKRQGLKPYDSRKCRACDKWGNLQELQDGLFVKDGEIFFRYDNLKKLRRLIARNKDGLGVDVIQKEQYPCNENYNIYDNTNLVSKGILVKRRMFFNKILKKNKAEDRNSIEVKLGKLPKGLTEGTYELNLLIIKEKIVCAQVFGGYLDYGGEDVESDMGIDDILIDTSVSKDTFDIKADKAVLTFKIYFEKQRKDAKASEIRPVMKALKSKEYEVDSIYITSYASIEGPGGLNEELKQGRSDYIQKAIRGRVPSLAYSGDAWPMFKDSIIGTDFEPYGEMSLEQAAEEIQKSGDWKSADLEAIFVEERFADIKMKVTYKITDENEEYYADKMFKDALDAGDAKLAFRIQAFIMEKILAGKYSKETLYNHEIPKESKYIQMLLKRIWFEKELNNEDLSPALCEKIQELAAISSSDQYVNFNCVFCDLKTSDNFGDPRYVDSLQAAINTLYESASGVISPKFIDALNLELQFKIMEIFDTIPENVRSRSESKTVEKTIKRIQQIYKIEEGTTWQNALKLAYIFMKREDYNYAIQLLEPFVMGEEEEPDEDVLFTFITLCTQFKDKMYSRSFRQALEKAKKINKRRYCALFKEPYLSFQLLDDPLVKSSYCKSCDGTETWYKMNNNAKASAQ